MIDPPETFIVQTVRGNFLTFLDLSVLHQRGLPGEAIIGQLLGDPVDPKLGQGPGLRSDKFRVNQLFVDFLHSVIARHAPLEPAFNAEVQRQQDGRIYVVDGRTPTPQGDVPAEDHVGAFEVRDGMAVAYRPYPGHRILTSRGVVCLTPFLHNRLMLELEQLAT